LFIREPGDELLDVEDELALAPAVEHDRDGTELEAGRRQPDEVRGDPLELHQQHAHDGRARRHLDAEQLLDAEAVDRLVEEVGEVVHPRDVGDALRPVAVLEVLLDARVQVADDDPVGHHRLALELEHHAEHAVRRRVLRPHVEDDALLVEAALRDLVVPVAAADVVDGLGHANDLRWSGGGICAPLYSTGTPPSG
jgi:hypothetical protein